MDRTADEIFDDHVNNFTKQQNAANKLQKELNNYIRCVKGATGRSSLKIHPNGRRLALRNGP